MMVTSLAIPDVKLIQLQRFGDARGFFSETYSAPKLAPQGIALDFVQDNVSLSRDPGTLRGLHLQLPPKAQAKLLTVLSGAVYDVAVDLRPNSPTFGQHVGATISAAEWNQILVPEGFGHGFCTLEPNTLVHYKVSAPYDRDLERALRWDDPDLGINWPLPVPQPTLSEKDATAPGLREFQQTILAHVEW